MLNVNPRVCRLHLTCSPAVSYKKVGFDIIKAASSMVQQKYLKYIEKGTEVTRGKNLN